MPSFLSSPMTRFAPGPWISGRLTRGERIAVRLVERLLAMRLWRLQQLLLISLFLVPKFKWAFNLLFAYRFQTGRADLDPYFNFVWEKRFHKYARWAICGPLGQRFAPQIFQFLLVGGEDYLLAWEFFEKTYLATQHGTGEKPRSYGLHRSVEVAYAGDLLVRLHAVDWRCAPLGLYDFQVALLIRMLDHCQHHYETCRFLAKDIGEMHFTLPLERYVPHFFQDRKLIRNLIEELDLQEGQALFEKLEADGEYWEQFGEKNDAVPGASDLNLFYAYRHLLLRTYHNGEGFYVPQIGNRMVEVQHRLRPLLPKPSHALKAELDARDIKLEDVRLLSPDWSALIGHNGHLNVHLMMRKMGWWQGQPVLLAHCNRMANPTFLSLFSDMCPTLISGENVADEVWQELASLTPFLGDSHQVFQFEDGRAMYWNDAGAMALQEWEAADRGFPLREIYDARLQANDEPEVLLQDIRRGWGMSPSDWFVCLHMRDSGTRNETEGTGESIRNTSLENYYEAVRYITAQGGWVVRMGSPAMPPLPHMPRVVDYARSSHRSALMDIHLMRRARFFIGTTSGFAYVASSFGIPTAMVNALSSVGLLWSTDTRFALKPVTTLEGRLLTQAEVTSEQWRWSFPTFESLSQAGLSVQQSSPDEILETVKEVYALTCGTPTPSPLLARWRASLSIPYFYGSAVPSAYFLEKYADRMLDATPPALVPQR
jgi:putative glycosyltransferase (TIGR04372 family)